MAPPVRDADPAVIRRLLREGRSFSFYQALRLLQLTRKSGVPLGQKGPARNEQIRLRPTTSLAFPTSDLEQMEEIETPQGQERYRVTTNFFGLVGSDSPLPAFYAEEVLHSDSEQEILRDFLDIFHHRLLSLLYRCGTKYRYAFQFRSRGMDSHSRRIFSMIGLREPEGRRELEGDALRLLRFTGLITQRPHSATTLQSVVSDTFGGLPVRVRQCIERWVLIREGERNRLGICNHGLGRNLSLGKRIRDRMGKFRVGLGPVDYPMFLRFLPDGQDAHLLHRTVRVFAPDCLCFEWKIFLSQREVPACRLESSGGLRLGWSRWLGTPSEDPVGVVFQKIL